LSKSEVYVIDETEFGTSWIPLDEQRKICVRCGFQEEAHSAIKSKDFDDLTKRRLRWFPRYGMGLCHWCWEDNPRYIIDAIEFNVVENPLIKQALIGDDGHWARMYGRNYDPHPIGGDMFKQPKRSKKRKNKRKKRKSRHTDFDEWAQLNPRIVEFFRNPSEECFTGDPLTKEEISHEIAKIK